MADFAEIDEIIRENERRKAEAEDIYDPVRGTGCVGERVEYDATAWDEGVVMLPKEMTEDKDFGSIISPKGYREMRCRYDFEYWAATKAMIKHKTNRRLVAFTLNRPQRKLLEVMESQRRRGLPVRVILLKARQWGGSTLIQIYMAWWQIELYDRCHSMICAHVKDASTTVRGIYETLVTNLSRSGKMRLRPFNNSRNISILPKRGNKLAIASIESQDAIRGGDYSMAHLTEVAFWRSSSKKRPEDFIRAICGSIHYGPETLIALESTANGVGNYFHREWLRTSRGESDKTGVFVAWYEIGIYTLATDNPAELWESMDDYERNLWRTGLTLEQINWYHCKRKEYSSHRQMMSEYPSTATEAFVNSASGVFGIDYIERLRKGTTEPLAIGDINGLSATGEQSLKGIRFTSDEKGCLRIWEFPNDNRDKAVGQRYIAGVDIGGVSDGADWSAITVMDCGINATDTPKIVASWRGHIDHDLLAWKCAGIAKWYDDALLVVESNTLEQEHTDGDPSTYILGCIGRHYRNLYYRRDPLSGTYKPGMHINRSSKTALITELVAAVRDEAYIERDDRACDEYAQYERQPSGSFAARDGCHDDLLMTRALIFGAIKERRVTPIDAVRNFCK